MDQQEYERDEARRHRAKLADVENASLADRKEARLEWETVMREHPETVAERIEWLLAGNYGFGAMQQAQRIARNKRMNRVAALAHLIAALEWSCPTNYARVGYLNLDKLERAEVDKRIAAAIPRPTSSNTHGTARTRRRGKGGRP